MKKVIILFLISTTLTFAKIIRVPDDQAKIQSAIEAALAKDTVLVAPGVFFENIDFLGKDITVASHFILDHDTTTIANTIIDGNHTATVVSFITGEPETALLCGFTLRNGYGELNIVSGMGIRLMNKAKPSLRNLVIEKNTGFLVGGISCNNATLNLSQAVIRNNTPFSPGDTHAGACSTASCSSLIAEICRPAPSKVLTRNSRFIAVSSAIIMVAPS